MATPHWDMLRPKQLNAMRLRIRLGRLIGWKLLMQSYNCSARIPISGNNDFISALLTSAITRKR